MSGGRFTDLPGKLRRGAELIRLEPAAIDLGDWLWITSVMHDAALKIEALERDVKKNGIRVRGWASRPVATREKAE